MQYFDELPKILYPNDSGEMVECTDIMVRHVFTPEFLSQPMAFYSYVWSDGDSPDKIAKYYYGSSSFAWLVMLSGNLFSWYDDLPVPQNLFEQYILKKTGMTIEEASQVIHHYVNAEGFIVDEFQGGTPVSVYEYEEALNESKRYIRLVSKDYVKGIKKEFRERIQVIESARSEGA